MERPQPRQEPEPATTRTAALPPLPPKAKVFALAATAIGRLVLWIFLAFFLDMTIGGLIGSVFGKHSGDLGTAGGMAIMTATVVFILLVGAVRKRRAGNRVTIIGDLRDTLERSLLRLPIGVLVTLAAILLPVAVTGAFSSVSPSAPV